MPKLKKLKKLAKKLGSPEQAKILQNYFKTKPGEYGAGDIFWGIKVPDSRQLAQEFTDLSFSELSELITSPIHELRFIALLIAIGHYEQAEKQGERKKILRWYWRHRQYINNWDLVDLSAPKILGAYLRDYPNERQLLAYLSQSANFWDRRLAIVSTLAFIRAGEFGPTLDLAGIFLDDPEELIHKASGWLLREVGKRNKKSLLGFLDNYGTQMPRIMLRYSIERLPESQRQKYKQKKKKHQGQTKKAL